MAADERPLAEIVTDLEVRLAFQDRAVVALDEVVRSLFARVETLEKEVKELRKSAGAEPVGPANEPPPHY